uniref:NADH-ubiquinone oxidoreductase chain 6 n=1 Tax=Neurigona zhejiangensis TaxID=2779314 RepID=A0A7M3UZQ7_9MUSC|nr:NADH dehydrogenase subunit 6 [Neurigona zhejiangensis]QOL12434.1 NADH dehydrogenase subunit 6 [Neurigona zhejiangensis]
MTQLMINSIIIMASTIFLKMNHPLAMGFMLLVQTFFIALISGSMLKTFWFSYVLFLIFIGGMMVLFIYVTSLASNEMFSMSTKLIIMCMIFTSLMLILSQFTEIISISPAENNEMMEMNLLKSTLKENTLTLNKIYNFPTNMLTLIMINYLLITLVAIVKITNVFYGPLRSMN